MLFLLISLLSNHANQACLRTLHRPMYSASKTKLIISIPLEHRLDQNFTEIKRKLIMYLLSSTESTCFKEKHFPGLSKASRSFFSLEHRECGTSRSLWLSQRIGSSNLQETSKQLPEAVLFPNLQETSKQLPEAAFSSKL